jgi:PPOX class probable FMN-dependent enzyme
LRKQIAALDGHCRAFIARSPFVVLSSAGADGRLDASPRGGAPGFARVTEDGQELIPDAPGNNRLDSLENIIATGRVGLLFMIPGFDETLRVNGAALLSRDAADIARCTDERRAPTLVIRVTVDEAYLHCAKAFMRSRLWDPAARVPRGTLPTMGQMLNDQTGIQTPAETQEEMMRRYQPDL